MSRLRGRARVPAQYCQYFQDCCVPPKAKSVCDGSRGRPRGGATRDMLLLANLSLISVRSSLYPVFYL
jgi:hypothetical protein